jgi:hypothetical protein
MPSLKHKAQAQHSLDSVLLQRFQAATNKKTAIAGGFI